MSYFIHLATSSFGGGYSFGDTRVKLRWDTAYTIQLGTGYLRISWDTGYLVGMIVFNEREIALHADLWDTKIFIWIGIQ